MSLQSQIGEHPMNFMTLCSIQSEGGGGCPAKRNSERMELRLAMSDAQIHSGNATMKLFFNIRRNC